MGSIKSEQGYHDLALVFYFKSLKAIDSIKYNKNELSFFESEHFKDIDSQLKLLIARKEIFHNYRPEDASVKFVHLANINRLIGEVYATKRNYQYAEEYLLKALNLNYRLADIDQLLMNENALSKMYLDQNKLDKAKESSQRCIQLAPIKGNFIEAATAYATLAEIERKSKNFSTSLNYIDSAKYYHNKYEKTKDWELAKLYKVRTLIDSLEVRESEGVINTTNLLVDEINAIDLESKLSNTDKLKLYYTLYSYYHQINNKDSIISYQTKFYQLKDSIIGLETQNRLSELLQLHESEVKDKKIETQEEKIIDYTEFLWLASVFLLIILLFAVYLFYSNRKMKNLNDEISELNEQLTESTKNKEELFTYIAHDLRGPLMTSGSVINMILSNDISEQRRQEYLISLQHTIRKSEMFTENLVHWAKTKSGTIVPRLTELLLEDLVSETLNSYSHNIAEKNLTIINDTVPISVQSDKVLLQAVVNNIVQNAVRYSYKDGTVNISSKGNSHSWELHVINKGETVPQETIDKFNSSQIVHSQKGHGIGLVIIKSYCDLLQLDCSLTSNSGVTTFTISNK